MNYFELTYTKNASPFNIVDELLGCTIKYVVLVHADGRTNRMFDHPNVR
jgi:hypothetical protein